MSETLSSNMNFTVGQFFRGASKLSVLQDIEDKMNTIYRNVLYNSLNIISDVTEKMCQ